MMISRTVFRNSLYIGLGTAFMAVIGMLNVFAERYIITGILTLSITILTGITLLTGAYAARSTESSSRTGQAITGALAGAIVIIVMLVIVNIVLAINNLVTGLGATQIFPSVTNRLVQVLAFGQEQPVVGYLFQVLIALVIGAVGGLAINVPARISRLLQTVILTILVLGLLQDQLNGMIALPDALWLAVVIGAGYALARWRDRSQLSMRVLEAAGLGAVIGLILAGLLTVLGGSSEGLPPFMGKATILPSLILRRSTASMLVLVLVVNAALAAVGAVLSSAPRRVHSIGASLLTAGLLLGILNLFTRMTLPAAIITAVVMAASQMLIQRTAGESEQQYEELSSPQRRTSQTMLAAAGLAFVLALPMFLTGYFNNVLDLIGLYVMMGLGLNIVVGFAGLLDLGYVAFFTIGAYTVGILTTPNALTCGVPASQLTPDQIAATCNLMTFWVAWPIAVLASGFAGILLGIPVLRLRGDYLAIVTLGFGEIIRLVALSDLGKPYFGGAQGIVSIPSPTINLTAIAHPLAESGIPLITQLGQAFDSPIALSQPNQIYYLILFGVLLTAFVSNRLSHSRLGRSWRAMKADEDVAQAMGINLVRTKLLAFSIGAAFSGLGGAIFGAYLKSIFPNSFTLLVSINVLSLIIIGGLGSIPGVFVGALVIFGLPEVLREFEEFRLLLFGALLVITMLLRPEGLLPPASAQLEEQAEKALAEEGA